MSLELVKNVKTLQYSHYKAKMLFGLRNYLCMRQILVVVVVAIHAAAFFAK